MNWSDTSRTIPRPLRDASIKGGDVEALRYAFVLVVDP
jgi:hypothetical protein